MQEICNYLESCAIKKMSILLTAILESMFLIHPFKCITEKTIISKEITICIIRILKLQESRNSKEINSTDFCLFLALDLECLTNLLPTTDGNECGYYNPGGICSNIVCIVVKWACSKVIAFQPRGYEIRSSSIELAKRNGKLKYIAV